MNVQVKARVDLERAYALVIEAEKMLLKAHMLVEQVNSALAPETRRIELACDDDGEPLISIKVV